MTTSLLEMLIPAYNSASIENYDLTMLTCFLAIDIKKINPIPLKKNHLSHFTSKYNKLDPPVLSTGAVLPSSPSIQADSARIQLCRMVRDRIVWWMLIILTLCHLYIFRKNITHKILSVLHPIIICHIL